MDSALMKMYLKQAVKNEDDEFSLKPKLKDRKKKGASMAFVSGPISAEPQDNNPRYSWQEINFELFVYDCVEQIYIPEQVYWSLIMEN